MSVSPESEHIKDGKFLAQEPELTKPGPGEDQCNEIDRDLEHVWREQRSSLLTVFASGAALISDGYQNNAMTMINVLFQKRYGTAVYNSEVSTRISNALLVGAVLGQIVVGVVCDRIGRKSAIVLSTLILCVGSILTSAAIPVHGSTSALFWWLTVTRGISGFGVGAEYPSSSTSCNEASNERYSKAKRSTVFILCTNVMLSFGGPLAVSIFLIILSASHYEESTSASDVRRLDITWRVVFGIGALLPLSVFYFRMKMMNSKLYRKGAIKHNVPYWLFIKRYWRRMIGTCGVWFLYDFVTFPNGAFSATIISSVLKLTSLREIAEWQLLLGSLSLPGAIIGAFLVSRIGTKAQLIAGFAGYLILGLTIGLAWNHIINIPALFVIFYGLFTSAGNIGPGSIAGLQSVAYPTALSGTAYAISAAIGKTGAALGTQAFTPIQSGLGKEYTFIVAAGIGVLGIIVSWFFCIDTSKLDLEKEDREWEAYLRDNNWHGKVGAPERGFDPESTDSVVESSDDSHAK